jgi:hypothetical protein
VAQLVVGAGAVAHRVSQGLGTPTHKALSLGLRVGKHVKHVNNTTRINCGAT